MPHLDPLSWAMWIIIVFLQPAIAVLMVKGGLWKRWLPLFVYLAFRSVKSIVLMGIVVLLPSSELQAMAYFWSYWIGRGICMLIEIWIINRIGCELGGCSRAARIWIRFAIPGIAITSLLLMLFMFRHDAVQFHSSLVRITSNLERVAMLAWLITLILVIYSAEFFGVAWDKWSKGLTIGYAINAIGSTGASWILSALGLAGLTFSSNIEEFGYILALSLWARVLLIREPSVVIMPEILNRLQSQLKTYSAVVERIR